MDEKKVRKEIDDFKELSVYMREKGYYGAIEHCDLAIEALEKQLPKKTIDKSCVKDNDTICGYIGMCPSCNDIVDDSMIVCDCTQVLDWSE